MRTEPSVGFGEADLLTTQNWINYQRYPIRLVQNKNQTIVMIMEMEMLVIQTQRVERVKTPVEAVVVVELRYPGEVEIPASLAAEPQWTPVPEVVGAASLSNRLINDKQNEKEIF